MTLNYWSELYSGWCYTHRWFRSLSLLLVLCSIPVATGWLTRSGHMGTIKLIGEAETADLLIVGVSMSAT
jgi:hypothetical protein